MSLRTAQANRAIAKAWEKEQEYVRNGQGTRDWTPDQQRDIIDPDIGKAYASDGKAFEGHHMKSVSLFPEFQGDPGNIQFLSHDEHKDAHGKNYQNPTNGYYDPDKGKMIDFGNGPFVPCNPRPLSNLSNEVKAIMVVNTGSIQDAIVCSDLTTDISEGVNDNKVAPCHSSDTVSHSSQETPPVMPKAPAMPLQRGKQSGGGFRQILNSVAERARIFKETVTEGLVFVGECFEDIKDDIKDVDIKDVAIEYVPDALSFISDLAQNYCESTLETLEREYRVSNTDSNSHSVQDSSSLSETVDDTDTTPGISSLNDVVSEDVDDIGSPKSPHLRQGHLSHYWIGPRNGERELVERWIDDIQVHGDYNSDEANTDESDEDEE